jgi:hypothetical protein
MKGDAKVSAVNIRNRKSLLILKVAMLFVCLFISIKFLQGFLSYSFAAGAMDGHTSYQTEYRHAVAWQFITMMAFIVFQLLGGAVLRALIGSDAINWIERIKSFLLFCVGFLLMTGLVFMVLVAMRKTI